MTLDSARRAARTGGYAAIVYAAATLGVVVWRVFGYGGELTNNFAAWVQDPIILIDVALALLLGVFMLRMSRVAALLMLVLFPPLQASNFVETGSVSSLVVAVLLFFFAVYAVHGTLTYHRRRREEDPTYSPRRLWHYVVAVPTFAVLAGLVFLAVAYAPQQLPQESASSHKNTFGPPVNFEEEIKSSGRYSNTLTQDGGL